MGPPPLATGRRTGTVRHMDLAYPPEAEEFRSEIAGWLKANLPEGWGGPGLLHVTERSGRSSTRTGRPSSTAAGGSAPAGRPSTAARVCRLLEQVVLNEEFARASAPLRADFFGDTLVGPTILHWGSEEQKRQFIPGS